MKGYDEFANVAEFKEYYKNIFESKDQDPVKIDESDDGETETDDDNKGNPVKTDDIEVEYADLKVECKNIFKHIIIFTNNKDPKKNKTLGNIYDAIKNLKKAKCDIIPELHIFIAAEIDMDDNGSHIRIYDEDNEFKIEKESNLDTLIFSRLSVQDNDKCAHIVEVLQDRGFLVLNPIKYSALACDKYDSAVLFQKGNIPQPRFTLMTNDILYDEKLYMEAMKDVYPDWDKDPDKNKDKDVVFKILDGHGGTGVSLIDGKRMYAVLQTIFAIDPERRLIIQKKEEADGGDIRVHVLTLRDKQIILGAMKRIKIANDFRSNVSLGASAEKVKLTPEQEQIALKTAKLSHLPWCAVDIMPLKKGSNKEVGDNVVLEINASPGTDGITDVLGVNFINILLNNLDEPGQFKLQDKTAGFIEGITLKFSDGTEKELLAKLDTGNSGSAITIEVGEHEVNDKTVKFTIDKKTFEFEKVDTMKVVAGDQSYERPVIILPEIKLGLRKMNNIRVAIVKSREKKTTNALLNRDLISRLGYVVHPSDTHILTEEIEKVKIL